MDLLGLTHIRRLSYFHVSLSLLLQICFLRYVDNDDNRVLQLNFDSPLADTFGLFDSGVDSPYAGRYIHKSRA